MAPPTVRRSSQKASSAWSSLMPGSPRGRSSSPGKVSTVKSKLKKNTAKVGKKSKPTLIAKPKKQKPKAIKTKSLKKKDDSKKKKKRTKLSKKAISAARSRTTSLSTIGGGGGEQAATSNKNDVTPPTDLSATAGTQQALGRFGRAAHQRRSVEQLVTLQPRTPTSSKGVARSSLQQQLSHIRSSTNSAIVSTAAGKNSRVVFQKQKPAIRAASTSPTKKEGGGGGGGGNETAALRAENARLKAAVQELTQLHDIKVAALRAYYEQREQALTLAAGRGGGGGSGRPGR